MEVEAFLDVILQWAFKHFFQETIPYMGPPSNMKE
jgi:hypothetical protein